MSILLSAAIAMMGGLLMTRIMKKFNLPDVTAYLIAGILIGPFFLGRAGIDGVGFVTNEAVTNMDLLSDLALGFIAFAIGNEFVLSKLKNTGRAAVIVGVFQALVASLFVVVVLVAVHFLAPDKMSLPAAIVLGAIASATAPAATLLVIRQYKAKGPVTSLLLPVVALDDAVGLMIFAVCVGIAKALQGGAPDAVSILVNPLVEIVGSIVLGSLLGWLLNLVEKEFHSNRNRLTLLISFVTMSVALSKLHFEAGRVEVGFSPLLVCMMMGTIFCNLCPIADELMDREDRWTAPLYCLFFVMSGSALRLDVFADLSMLGIGVLFIVFRSLGKCLGAAWSSKMAGCEPVIQKYLGLTLLPQAGVALGMSLSAAAQLGEDGAVIRSITLLAVLVFELIGPSITKYALTKAGDIQEKSDEVKNRRQNLVDAAKQK